MSRWLGTGLLISVCLLGLASIPAGFAAGPTYPTSAVMQSGMKETTIAGYSGVLINYTNGLSTRLSSFVYVYLVNRAGQTIYWGVGSCNFSAGEEVQWFAVFSSTVSSGNYTANLFVTTSTGVPVSTTSSLSVTV